MNIFEGSRRIVKVISVLVLIGFGITCFYIDPDIRHPSFVYVVANPTIAPQRMNSEFSCPPGDSIDWTLKKTAKGTLVSVTLCFKTTSIKDSQNTKFILYLNEATKQLTLGIDGTKEIKEYKTRFTDAFELPPEDATWVDEQRWPEFFKKLLVYFCFMLLGLLALWLLAWGTGWIVHGFMGIPRGQDKKSQT
jgi:hypothetical protein